MDSLEIAIEFSFPKMITIEQLANLAGISKNQAYQLYKSLPANCKVRLGKRIRLLEEPLRDWLLAGGHRVERAERSGPQKAKRKRSECITSDETDAWQDLQESPQVDVDRLVDRKQ